MLQPCYASAGAAAAGGRAVRIQQTRPPPVTATAAAGGAPGLVTSAAASASSTRSRQGSNPRRPRLSLVLCCSSTGSSGSSSDRCGLQGSHGLLQRRRPGCVAVLSTAAAAGVYGTGSAATGVAAVAAAVRRVAVACVSSGSSSEGPTHGSSAFAGASGSRRRAGKGGRRSRKPDPAAPAPSSSAASGGSGGGGGGGTSITSGPAPSAASSPVPAPSPGAGAGGGGVAAAASSSSAGAAVAVVTRSLDGSGSDSEYEASAGGSSTGVGGNIVPFVRRQPRALVLDCAYRPINVLTWYKAFHFDYFGKGEVLEYYPPPAVCTTGSGEHPLPAVLRVPQYTADMQDLCSRVACSRRNIMVRDGFCCQYCGSRRDLTLDHVHPVSKGGKETWENLVTACMRCNQKKSDRTLRELGWKLRRQPKEPTPFEIGIVAGISTSDLLRPPPEWEAYIAPYRERLEMYRRAAVEAGLVNLIDDN
ncbi:hypothetical protein PLESTB_001458400 [Pleodorina starrii]|uniref:HNH nuclease domain-containing protein n=1 Tax=Pleodorina starrii TaxID=330485 RepID=A0A9W6F7C5_9CHLO|nr:hypothetical protein PLESTM_002045500 [Pleodorina starrii]GLC59187.1 hypothetical protein PLESTB_001458400 [Pleodorina starrii]